MCLGLLLLNIPVFFQVLLYNQARIIPLIITVVCNLPVSFCFQFLFSVLGFFSSNIFLPFDFFVVTSHHSYSLFIPRCCSIDSRNDANFSDIKSFESLPPLFDAIRSKSLKLSGPKSR